MSIRLYTYMADWILIKFSALTSLTAWKCFNTVCYDQKFWVTMHVDIFKVRKLNLYVIPLKNDIFHCSNNNSTCILATPTSMYSTYVLTRILKANWLNYSVLENNNIWPHITIFPSTYLHTVLWRRFVSFHHIGSKAYILH